MNVKMTASTKTAAVMTTLVIEKMHAVLLKIWKSQGTLNIGTGYAEEVSKVCCCFQLSINEALVKRQ